MRRLWILYLTLGLTATQGCHKTLRYTAGVCDAYPPPVESLLVGPCPTAQDNVVAVAGPYAAAPYAAVISTGPNGQTVSTPGSTIPTQQPATTTVPETIRSLPSAGNPKR